MSHSAWWAHEDGGAGRARGTWYGEASVNLSLPDAAARGASVAKRRAESAGTSARVAWRNMAANLRKGNAHAGVSERA